MLCYRNNSVLLMLLWQWCVEISQARAHVNLIVSSGKPITPRLTGKGQFF